MVRQHSNKTDVLLADEINLLERISRGADLRKLLEEICTTLDNQIGNIVSLVLFADEQEHALHRIARSAAQFGLSLFACSAVVSSSDQLLGTLEVYCCFDRTPNLEEWQLIERTAHLAALAMQCHGYGQHSGDLASDWIGVGLKSSCEDPPRSN